MHWNMSYECNSQLFMISKKSIQLFVFLCALLISVLSNNALADTGICTEFNFPLSKNGEVDWPAKVIIQNTPVYKDATSSYQTDQVLPFNKSLIVVKAENFRVQVRHINAENPLGWVERSALLCTLTPIKDENGLEQRVFIRLTTELRKNKPVTVKAYPSPDIKDCEGQCLGLSSFEPYFVFNYDKKHNTYLVGNYRVNETFNLIGWVDKKSCITWNTYFGLRPRENLVYPKDHKLAGQERTVCAYPSLENAVESKNCMPILGGNRWFKIEHRIPILDQVEKQGKSFYKVLLPLAGMNSNSLDNKRIIHPHQLGYKRGISSLLNMKKIDVLFLIDGTNSMEPYIESIRGSRDKPGAVQEIIESLKDDPLFKEAQFRFGFRIYRDKYAGHKELGEGFPMPSQCEPTRDMLYRNITEFNNAIETVDALPPQIGRDDYADNVFGGIKQAINDLTPCPTHTKILFIIGDNGYDANAQRRRGRAPVKMSYLVNKLKGSVNNSMKNIVTFFIQTPDNRRYAKHPEHYDNAHRLFRNQAYEILHHILPPGNKPDDYFMQSNDRDLNAKIIAGAKGFSNTQAVNDLILDLRGGTSLKDAIKRLQGSKEYNNIPGLFWEITEQASAKELGKQYDSRIYDAILEGYIPVSEDIVEDVWLTSNDLQEWILLLKQFGDHTHLSGSEIRKALGYAIKDALEKLIRKPLYEDTGESLDKYLKRIESLPIKNISPLLRYTLADFADKNKVPDCELIRLVTWLNNSRQMLEIVCHGDMRPKFKKEKFPGKCHSGTQIPFITGDIKRESFPSPDMRFDHYFQKGHIYWVPTEYLP